MTASPVTESAPLKYAKKSTHLVPLDGVRGLAILFVFLYHYGAGGVNSSSSLVRTVGLFCGLGWSGVDMFFVLSGFLITGILYDTQENEGYYRKFYVRRSLRIFPIYYLVAAILVAILPFAVWQKPHLFFLAYLGYPAALVWPTLVQEFPVRITHLWSLSIEEQFYLFWPFAIKRLRTKENILRLCGIMIVFALLARFVLAQYPGWAYGFALCRVDALSIGAAIAMLTRAQIKIPAWWMLGLGSAATLLVCAWRQTVDHADYWLSTIGFTFIAFAFGGLLVLSLGPLATLFSNRGLLVLGKYSYGLYLYHFPLTSLGEKAKPLFSGLPMGSILYVVACLAINIGIAMLSFHAIEGPILRLKKRWEY